MMVFRFTVGTVWFRIEEILIIKQKIEENGNIIKETRDSIRGTSQI